MIDLTTIPEATIIARGQYATIRGAHEDQKKRLAALCGELQTTAMQVLRRLQPSEDEIPESVAEMLTYGRMTMDRIEECAAAIDQLAKQRAELRPIAWGRGK